MALRGRAFLSLWSGLLTGYERELDRWHTVEHMPERMGVPGFLRGRRYMNTRAAAEHAMLIVYEAAHIETFRSPALLARLNDPTEWSKKVQPGLVNFIRGSCRTMVSIGDGIGGATVAIRISGDIPDKLNAAQKLVDAASAMGRVHGVTAVHVGEYVNQETDNAEARLRAGNPPTSMSFVVLVEGFGVQELEDARAGLVDLAFNASSGICEAGVYRLAYLLDAA